LLFEALHRQAVDYVVIGGFAAIAHGRALFTKDIDLTFAPTIENCTALTEALLSLDAHRCLSPHDRKLLDPRRAPTRMLDREYVLDTAAGGLDLRLPRFVPGCPPYPEIRAASAYRQLGGNLQIKVASLDHLIQMRHAFRLIDDWRSQGAGRRPQDREALPSRGA